MTDKKHSQPDVSKQADFDDRFDHPFNTVFDDTFDIKKTEEDFSLHGDKRLSGKHFEENCFEDNLFADPIKENEKKPPLTSLSIKKNHSSLLIAMGILALGLISWTLYDTFVPKHMSTKAVIKKIIQITGLPILSHTDRKKANV